MNSYVYKLSVLLAIVSNWLYRHALTSYIKKQNKMLRSIAEYELKEKK